MPGRAAIAFGCLINVTFRPAECHKSISTDLIQWHDDLPFAALKNQ